MTPRAAACAARLPRACLLALLLSTLLARCEHRSPQFRSLAATAAALSEGSLIPGAVRPSGAFGVSKRLGAINGAPARDSEWDVRDFGAVGDGRAYDTAALQEAVDVAAGLGGVVVFPAGYRFLTGTLFLRSGVSVRVERGATILGSARREDYPDSRDRWYVILAENVTGVTISGGGEINGQARAFVADRHPPQFADKYAMVSWNQDPSVCADPVQCRPRLLGLVNATRVTLADLFLNQPAYWCLHVYRSADVAIRGLDIFGDPHIPNNDGIDIDGSKRVEVSDCTISTADDGVCVKTSGKAAPTVDGVLVQRCAIRSKSCAVKFGSESTADMANVVVRDVVVADSNRGLGLQIRDGASVANVTFRNVSMVTRLFDPASWWGRAEPIYVTNRPRDWEGTPKVGFLRNVTFQDISATSEAGIVIAGRPGDASKIDGLTFANVSVRVERLSPWPGGQFDFRPGVEVVNHSIPLLYGEHASNLVFNHVSLEWGPVAQPYWGPGIQMFNRTVHNVRFVDVSLSEP
ncbi:unnamed protein product [Ostreobium quekettii]|uniref:Uncharacterized protein n=1 Tax=Ostreobium quekettii TaxID=121088 RepID=A0A8S1IVB4_9CHLO|nr:unnamed protein product [Ostreobium quekettii]|eukprot:evm.model.scf_337.3 EVM.evm.TU.scf_337.3   scf_337:13324-16572(-)